jgi:hypothetical protein
MSGDLSTVEKSMEEILIDLMAEKGMSIGVQASSTRGLQASTSIGRRSGPSRTTTEKRSKHRDDLANAKLIPSVLPNYIPPLASAVSHDSVREISNTHSTLRTSQRGYAQLDCS